MITDKYHSKVRKIRWVYLAFVDVHAQFASCYTDFSTCVTTGNTATQLELSQVKS